jgi:hypothetical protein
VALLYPLSSHCDGGTSSWGHGMAKRARREHGHPSRTILGSGTPRESPLDARRDMAAAEAAHVGELVSSRLLASLGGPGRTNSNCLGMAERGGGRISAPRYLC